jgi:ATP-dependent Zn protease
MDLCGKRDTKEQANAESIADVGSKGSTTGMTYNRDLELSLVHESAHAVIYWIHGYVLRKIWINRATAGGWTGISCDEQELNSFDRLVSILAGEIAEEELLGHVETRETRDRKRAMEIARRINAEMPAAVVDCAHRQARRLVQANADAIRMLAAALLDRGSLSGKDIAALLLQHQQQWRRAA